MARSLSLISVGAGPGVGMEVARRFGRAGYQIGLIRRNPTALGEMIATLRAEGINASGVAADAHDPDQLTTAITELAVAHSGIDVLHHAAPGPLGQGYGPMLEVDPRLLETFLDARVVSALVAAQAAAPYLRDSSGALLFTSGSAALSPYPGVGIVSVPQAALRMLTAYLREELGPDGVFVGHLPISGVPAYRDPAADAARTDVRDGVALATDRLTAADVAEAHYRVATRREPAEWVIGNDEIGLADREDQRSQPAYGLD